MTEQPTTHVAGRWQDPERRMDVLDPADGSHVGLEEFTETRYVAVGCVE